MIDDYYQFIITKNKLSQYVDDAQDLERLIEICKKFLKKYKPELVKPPMPPQIPGIMDDPWLNIYESYENQIINSINSPKVLTASILCSENISIEYRQKELASYLSEEILKSDVVRYDQYKDPMTFSIITKARVGVCKP